MALLRTFSCKSGQGVARRAQWISNMKEQEFDESAGEGGITVLSITENPNPARFTPEPMQLLACTTSKRFATVKEPSIVSFRKSTPLGVAFLDLRRTQCTVDRCARANS